MLYCISNGLGFTLIALGHMNDIRHNLAGGQWDVYIIKASITAKDTVLNSFPCQPAGKGTVVARSALLEAFIHATAKGGGW